MGDPVKPSDATAARLAKIEARLDITAILVERRDGQESISDRYRSDIEWLIAALHAQSDRPISPEDDAAGLCDLCGSEPWASQRELRRAGGVLVVFCVCAMCGDAYDAARASWPSPCTPEAAAVSPPDPETGSATAWLIERSQPEKVDPPQYWANVNGADRTNDPRQAHRFATREAAESALVYGCGALPCDFHGHVAEHVFLTAVAPETALPSVGGEMSTEEQLSPCPFYGGEAVMQATARNDGYVLCIECYVRTPEKGFGWTKRDATAHWNRRSVHSRASSSREVSEEDETRAAGIILRELQQGGRIRITDDFAATVARCVLKDFVASGGTT